MAHRRPAAAGVGARRRAAGHVRVGHVGSRRSRRAHGRRRPPLAETLTNPPLTLNTIGSWQAERVRADQVLSALSELRRHEERAATRTSVMTLVIVVGSSDAAEEHLDVVRHLG